MWQIRWQIYPPEMAILAHIWQIRWQIYFLPPPRNGNFTFLLIDPYSESSHVGDQVADIPPRNGNFIFLLIDSFFKSSHVADQVADIPPKKAILDSYL